MNVLIGIALVAMAGLGIWLYWRMRRKRASRMISLVALLREPVTFDATVLAKIAGRAWSADLGDGTAEGEDGFVVSVGSINTIMHGDRPYLVNCIPSPYVEDPETVSESIVDLRVRRLFGEHQAWFSCDALGVDGTSTAEEISDSYRGLARLFVEFLDENCLLIYIPDTSRAYSINDETERALMSNDPLVALQETRTSPVVPVSADDSLMQEAVAKAWKSWPQFVNAFEATAGENFSIKAPVSYLGTTEFIWLTVTAVEGDQVYGTLANDPANLGPLKLGSKVSVTLSDVNDWCYIDSQGNLQGGFTIAAVQEASRRQQKT
jgi:uncharacterized protein YegJ (DUF2314 family)